MWVTGDKARAERGIGAARMKAGGATSGSPRKSRKWNREHCQRNRLTKLPKTKGQKLPQ